MLDTFCELRDHVAVRVNASREADIERVSIYCQNALEEVWRRFRWPERRREVLLTATAAEEISFTSTQDATTVTVTDGTPTQDWVGRKFANLGNPPYGIKKVAGQVLTLDRPMFEESATDIPGCVYLDTIILPPDVGEIIEQEVFLMVENGQKLDYLLETDFINRQPYATSIGAPQWFAMGPKTADIFTGDVTRTIRLGWVAPDRPYVVRVPYYTLYPKDVGETDPILIPEENRDLVVWLALSTAFSEYPFADTEQCERWEGKYERELDKALRSQGETDTEIMVIETFDS